MRRAQGLEVVSTSGLGAVKTSAVGTDWVQLGARANLSDDPGELLCNQVVIYNETGTDLRWRYCDVEGAPAAADGIDLPILDGTAVPVRGIQDARQVQIKRDDDSNTQVTVNFVREGA